MTRLELEFIPQHRIPWFGLAFLSVSVLTSAVVGAQWLSLYREQLMLTEQVAALEKQLKTRQRAQAQQDALTRPELERRAKEEKAVFAALHYPWNQVFAEIERPDIDHLAVLSFSHDQASRTSQLTVEALDVGTLVKYVEALNEGLPEAHWYIQSYKLQQQNVPQTVTAQISTK